MTEKITFERSQLVCSESISQSHNIWDYGFDVVENQIMGEKKKRSRNLIITNYFNTINKEINKEPSHG